MLILEELEDDSLDTVLSLSIDAKVVYFSTLITNYYPKVDKNSEEFQELLEYYISCFYVEKLYRSNRFFNQKFTPIYTETGLIRNIIADRFFNDTDLLVH